VSREARHFAGNKGTPRLALSAQARLLRRKSALARAPRSIEAIDSRTRTPEAMNEDARRNTESVAIDLTRSRAKQDVFNSSLSFSVRSDF
jgi:hypothetical protein